MFWFWGLEFFELRRNENETIILKNGKQSKPVTSEIKRKTYKIIMRKPLVWVGGFL